jgi:hypothetical protein
LLCLRVIRITVMGFRLWHLPSNALSLDKQLQSGYESNLLHVYPYIDTIRRQSQNDVAHLLTRGKQ